MLEEQTAIPAVAQKLSLIQEVQTSLFWDDVNIIELERVRKDLRDLIQFVERRGRAAVITDFVDEMSNETIVVLPGTSVGVDIERVRDKAFRFLREHESDPVIHKLRFNEPLSEADLIALEGIFLSEGSTPEELEALRQEVPSLGLFVRSLVGMDCGAAKNALSKFIQEGHQTANQIEFTNLILNHLTSRGWIELRKLYASPFTDVHPYGIEGLFDDHSTLNLIAALESIRQNASGPIV